VIAGHSQKLWINKMQSAAMLAANRKRSITAIRTLKSQDLESFVITAPLKAMWKASLDPAIADSKQLSSTMGLPSIRSRDAI
jgi:hypothetical protein